MCSGREGHGAEDWGKRTQINSGIHTHTYVHAFTYINCPLVQHVEWILN